MRHAIAILTALLGLVAPGHATLAARADEPPRASLTVTCPPVAEPGRVRCEVEARPPKGTAIKTADVIVTRVPALAVALRARVGPLDAATREDAAWRWAIALAAKERGEGEVALRARIVACAAPDSCAPYVADAAARVVVGP